MTPFAYMIANSQKRLTCVCQPGSVEDEALIAKERFYGTYLVDVVAVLFVKMKVFSFIVKKLRESGVDVRATS